jgi:hypothetical protein
MNYMYADVTEKKYRGVNEDRLLISEDVLIFLVEENF